jgi:hypothetical protein
MGKSPIGCRARPNTQYTKQNNWTKSGINLQRTSAVILTYFEIFEYIHIAISSIQSDIEWQWISAYLPQLCQ